MIMGIDIGGTNTQGVIMDGDRIVARSFIMKNTPEAALECLKQLLKDWDNKEGIRKIAVTGGGSRTLTKDILGRDFKSVDELEAIGKGGVYLSGKSDVFVVSIGTGTAFVSVKNGNVNHIGGTGLGGGTIHGLSELMLKMPLDKVEEMARNSGSNLDLTVKDVVGGDIGKIPGSATASNFGNTNGICGKPEVASSMLNMVAESIGVMSYFAAKTVGQENNILICGRVAMNGVIKNRITETIDMLGGSATIPKNAEHCAAIGAALH